MNLEKLTKKIEQYNFSTVPCKLLRNKKYALNFIKSKEGFFSERKMNSLKHRAYLITQFHLEVCKNCYNYYTKIANKEIGKDKWNKIFALECAFTLKILEKFSSDT